MKIEADTSCNPGRGRIFIQLIHCQKKFEFYIFNAFSEMLVILDLRKSPAR